MASSSTSPCAACKFLRRKCQPECVFAPYFPPDQPQNQRPVHKVFGASNVTKLLNELRPAPVYGCVGVISLLQHQLRQLQMDLSCAKSELSKYQNLGLSSHGLIAAAHHHHHHQGINILGGGGGVSSRDHHHFHHQLFPVNQQQVIRAFDGSNGYDASGLLAMNMSSSIGQLSGFQPSRAAADGRRTPVEPS
ncbi:LOW QUALITY PROTEIN: LOB domain-containing protein 6 [Sesamum indicum]|uniref:LOW QUALITY PROTEIN: LOB domain-containing protein 6 n=1 Tax=Sesamum indicum TaxID=4182 RepID=A0A8M8V4I3_SESIN|nr:LOW QUALITY PROTEIN: LOB domain-containing protein 6 [Sesamum indicum]